MSAQAINFSWTWTVTAPLTLVSLPPGPANVGEPVSYQFVVTGGTPPYVFTATGLPPGIVMSSTGLLTGTPTMAGEYNVSGIISDSGS